MWLITWIHISRSRVLVLFPIPSGVREIMWNIWNIGGKICKGLQNPGDYKARRQSSLVQRASFRPPLGVRNGRAGLRSKPRCRHSPMRPLLLRWEFNTASTKGNWPGREPQLLLSRHPTGTLLASKSVSSVYSWVSSSVLSQHCCEMLKISSVIGRIRCCFWPAALCRWDTCLGLLQAAKQNSVLSPSRLKQGRSFCNLNYDKSNKIQFLEGKRKKKTITGCNVNQDPM